MLAIRLASDDVLLLIVDMYCCVSLCVAICCYVLVCVDMCHNVLLCAAMCRHVSLYVLLRVVMCCYMFL